MKIKRCVRIQPASEAGLREFLTEKRYATPFAQRLDSGDSVVRLSPKLSSYVIDRLASIDSNHGAMRDIAESLSSPTIFRNAAALQEDALRVALAAFGLAAGSQALSLELVEEKETALARVAIMEDSVVEHDARSIPEYDLIESDLTGRAVFERGDERLEVFTANKRPLEHVFGVDLIYLNAIQRNMVMVQYKMLESVRRRDETDWIYRPDAGLQSEIKRMRQFAVEHPAQPHEYRLNPAVFFLKFVKRDRAIGKGGIIIPIDHYEKLCSDPACKGPRGGLRISYEGLAGRYLRQNAFLQLISSGYIGSRAETTEHLKTLVEAVLSKNRAVVAALQTQTVSGQRDQDSTKDNLDYEEREAS